LQVAGLLQVWLKELPEPLIRSQLFAQVVDSQKHQGEGERLLSLQAVLKQVKLQALAGLLALCHADILPPRTFTVQCSYETACVLLTSDSNLCAVCNSGTISINKSNRLTGTLCAAE